MWVKSTINWQDIYPGSISTCKREHNNTRLAGRLGPTHGDNTRQSNHKKSKIEVPISIGEESGRHSTDERCSVEHRYKVNERLADSP